MKRRVKVLLAKLGLDVHSRGVITVASYLKNAGMEVVYIGNAFPKEIVQTAIEEDVDAVGVSSLGGAHLTLGGLLVKEAIRVGLNDKVALLIGGVFPPADGELMRQLGFDGIFTPGATGEDIVTEIKRLVQAKANH